MIRSTPVRFVAGVALAVGAASPATAGAADPTKDQCIDANEAAQRLRDGAKLRASRAQLEICVAKSCPGPVRDDCAERIAAVDKAIPSVVVVATGPDGKELATVRVTMDDELVAEKLEGAGGAGIAAEPGQHAFRFEAPGLAPVTSQVTLAEGEKRRRIDVAFVDTKGAVGDVPPGDGPAAPPPVRPAGAVQFAGRLGYGVPAGGVTGVAPDSLSSSFGGQLTLLLEAGLKVTDNVFVGAYGSLAGGITGATSTECEAADASCSSSSLHLGVQGQYHVRPAETLDPWFGLGAGWEIATGSVKLVTPPTEKAMTVHGPEIARLMAGLDYRLDRHAGFGPYFDLAIGQYLRKSASKDGIDTSGGIDDRALHAWFILGLRAVVFP